MKLVYHKNLSPKKWFSYSISEQMANIGSEVFRTISWRKKDKKLSQLAFERSLELFDITIEDPKNLSVKNKEILRAREMWCDFIFGDNQYKQTDKLWQNYFYAFNFAARLERVK
ncbi:MAG: Uncharacterized protein CEN91_162 [Candidatus Berkelbacteria bacterium Licking1014_85]|uniref:Uncharacterized protein n=1 Tax=Candidatus Berkelbacteria bacterium Licking1014_85 TaxID=2017148 RepID=A0A554LLB1_9BACT|nr:MAG: Uncharacterized protein CEN91_162 [Candidatus Berkelbacteria bacterium Licking1014_85]